MDTLPPGFFINFNKYAALTGKPNKMPDKIPSDYKLGLMFGSYLEGGVSHLAINRDGTEVGSVRWYIPPENKEFCETLVNTIEDVTELRATYFHRPHKHRQYTVLCNSKPLTRFFREFGTTAAEKHLPKKYLVSNEDYLRGLLDGIREIKEYSPNRKPKPHVDFLISEVTNLLTPSSTGGTIYS